MWSGKKIFKVEKLGLNVGGVMPATENLHSSQMHVYSSKMDMEEDLSKMDIFFKQA